jgi:phosphopantothenoylcysteine decarboxylase/phosphopantothenate--cysteine ligase
MNTAMWENAATRENLAALNKRGVTVLPVGEGALACGGFGAGRMIEVPEIADYLLAGAVAGRCFAGKKILISSGPTMEPLDPVRVITNRSSGKMGAALARAGLMGGADVTVVSGPAAAPLPSGARVVRVVTAAQMRDAMIAEFEQTDICIMAAAVGDFRPVKFHSKKIRRIAGDRIALELESTPDILAELGKRKGSRFLIGFALETGEGVAHAKQKMRAKGCDMMVLNRPEEALAGDQTRITIFGLEGAAESCPAMGKDEAAGIILKRAAVRLGLIHD